MIHCAVILFLLMLVMISPAKAQVVSCGPTSPQCCWVVRSWQKMGKATLVNHNNSTACCNYLGSITQSSGIDNVYCDSDGTVTEIRWTDKNLTGSIPDSILHLVDLEQLNLGGNQLTGPIPPEIGSLTNLTWIYQNGNQLSGQIPTEIGNLVNLARLNQLSGPIPDSIGRLENLQELYVNDNPGLNGKLNSNCQVQILAMNTALTAICGCASSSSVPISMPNSDNVPAACLAVFSNTTGHAHYEFLCSMDSSKNPKQDCLNSLAFFCGRAHIQGNPDLIAGCKMGVDNHFSKMNSFWITWRKHCGHWAWTDGTIGSVTSSSCNTAFLALEQNAKYTAADGTLVPFSSALLNSIKAGLWDNPFLQ